MEHAEAVIHECGVVLAAAECTTGNRVSSRVFFIGVKSTSCFSSWGGGGGRKYAVFLSFVSLTSSS